MSLSCVRYPFIWDGVPSEIYGLTIGFVTTDYNNVPSGSGFSMVTDRVADNITTTLFNEIQDQVLQFPVEIYCENIDVFQQTWVKHWLFTQRGYKRLQICMDLHNTFYYNCKLVPNTDVIYEAPRGFRFDVICDSPGAWEFPRIVEHRFPNQQYYEFRFNNLSGNMDYMKPIIEFTTTNGSRSFTLQNHMDLDSNGIERDFSFTGLNNNETITIDNENKLITSSTGLLRLQNFNKKFFRFVKGVNEVTAVGNCSLLRIKYQNFRQLGGAVY